jgi:hypothetical protein
MPRRSFDVGPRVGELCQRNWRTLALARERHGPATMIAHQARERLQRCQVEDAAERFCTVSLFMSSLGSALAEVFAADGPLAVELANYIGRAPASSSWPGP